jgi:hypothetical protein
MNSEFLTDVLALIRKHKSIHYDIKIAMLEIVVKNAHNQQDEIKEAMKKHKIFYHNNSNN